MSSANPKGVLYRQFAEVAKALGHGYRLEILELLAQGERSVEALAEHAGWRTAFRNGGRPAYRWSQTDRAQIRISSP